MTGATSTSAAGPRLTELAHAARVIRDAVRDRSYERTPVGVLVHQYLRWKRIEWGASEATVRDYEYVLARLALWHADLQVEQLEPRAGTATIRSFWTHHWGTRSARTRAKVLSIIRDFTKWLVAEGHLVADPAAPIRRPRLRHAERDTYTVAWVEAVLERGWAEHRERVALKLLFELGLRKNELAQIRLRHYDADRHMLRIYGKGGKIRELPVVRDWVRVDLEAYIQERYDVNPERWHDEHLLYPTRRMPTRNPDGPPTRLWENRYQQLEQSSVHRWWYRCLDRAGVPPGNMHRARHTALTDFLRQTGNLKLTQILAGHTSIATTGDIYGHLDIGDLEQALHRIAEGDE